MEQSLRVQLPDTCVLVGRENGEAFRAKMGDAEKIVFVLSPNTYTMSSSYLLGLMGPVWHDQAAFYRKYSFEGPSSLVDVLDMICENQFKMKVMEAFYTQLRETWNRNS